LWIAGRGVRGGVDCCAGVEDAVFVYHQPQFWGEGGPGSVDRGSGGVVNGSRGGSVIRRRHVDTSARWPLMVWCLVLR
jgi:hypothetical protein